MYYVIGQMSNMDSERCWGEAPGCNQEYDCGPDSGVFLPAVYRLDPAQVRQQKNHSAGTTPTFSGTTYSELLPG